jgi:hypothetical protein
MARKPSALTQLDQLVAKKPRPESAQVLTILQSQKEVSRRHQSKHLIILNPKRVFQRIARDLSQKPGFLAAAAASIIGMRKVSVVATIRASTSGSATIPRLSRLILSREKLTGKRRQIAPGYRKGSPEKVAMAGFRTYKSEPGYYLEAHRKCDQCPTVDGDITGRHVKDRQRERQ